MLQKRSAAWLFYGVLSAATVCAQAARARDAETHLPSQPRAAASGNLEHGFDNPPETAKPWVYWFVMDGHQSRAGITADLEAMKRVGLGGLLMMEVDVGRIGRGWRVGRGGVPFMSPKWRACFKHLNAEAARLGLTITLNSGPGWTGSGGPWIKPEQSMQKLVASETAVSGPQRFNGRLAQPKAVEGYYRDVAVLAFPTPPEPHRIKDIAEKALYTRGFFSSAPAGTVQPWIPASAQYRHLTADEIIAKQKIVDLTGRMDAQGRLSWQVPPGRWTVMRLGHTSTGSTTRPAPRPGLGLECDKLDGAALDAHFDAYLAKLLDDVGPLAGKSWVALHIDSWEMGPQNWTARFPEEFRRRRGYDILRYLPVTSGYVVESLEVSERFLWDLRQTVLELISEHYSGRLARLAHRHGLRLSIEPYDCTPCDDMTYGSRADVPMCEFWTGGFNTWFSVAEASSVAHTYGKPIVQAEAFTSLPRQSWQRHPGSLKPLGDIAFCEGINRLVFHRYAHQPWLDRRPGMTMGPFGIHYERTSTWWEPSKAWNEYLARCQFLLQQGLFVADVLYLTPEASPQAFRPLGPTPPSNPNGRFGYNYDGCTPEALLTRAAVEDGRIVMPDGMSYRALFLPKIPTMTPRLLRKIRQLVADGATVVGPRPLKSPSLSGHPQCDGELKRLADELWGADRQDDKIAERPYGRGTVISGKAFATSAVLPPDSEDLLTKAKWIWYPEGNPARSAPPGYRYFRRVVRIDPGKRVERARLAVAADNEFTVFINGRRVGSGRDFRRPVDFAVAPLLRGGENTIELIAKNTTDRPSPAGAIATLAIRFHDGTSQRVVTDKKWQAARTVPKGWPTTSSPDGTWAAVMELGPNGMRPWSSVGPKPRVEAYAGAKDVSAVLARLGLPPDFESDRPLRYIHRRAGDTDIYFVASSHQVPVTARCTLRVAGKLPEIWDPVTGRRWGATAFEQKDGRTSVPLEFPRSGSLFVVFREPTRLAKAEGRNFPRHHLLSTIAGPWTVEFDPKWGGPAEPVVFDRLTDWTKRPEEGVKYYSGTAVYRTSLDVDEDAWPPKGRRLLDLGSVEVMARVRLNDKDLGVVWTPLLRVDITDTLRPGRNTLEVEVVSCWPNRLIGDEHLPEQKRYTWSTWNPYKKDSPLLPSGLLGPVRILEAKQQQ